MTNNKSTKPSKLAFLSSIGLLALGITLPTIIYLNMNKFEAKLQKDVLAWNTKLPEGYHLKLENNCSYPECKGRYSLFYKNEKGQENLDAYLDYSLFYNITSFLLPNQSMPLQGSVTLENKEFVNDYLITKVDLKDKHLLTFSGNIKNNGEFNIDFEKNQVQLSVSEEDSPPLFIIKDTEKSKGNITFDKYTLKASVQTPKVLITSSNLEDNGLQINNIKVNSKTDVNRKQENSSMETSGEILIESILDTTIDRSLEAKNLSTSFSFIETPDNFTHQTVLKAEEFTHANIGKLSYLVDYDITVPISSKQALIDFLQTIQTSDMETRQGAFYEILKNGFKFDLNNFNVTELDNHNKIESNLSLNMNKFETGKSFVDRLNFDANLLSQGEMANNALALTGLNLESLTNENSDKDKSSEPVFDYKLNISYKNGEISFNKKNTDKVFSNLINNSLISLENLLKEGEENYIKFKSGDVTALTIEETDHNLEIETPPELAIE